MTGPRDARTWGSEAFVREWTEGDALSDLLAFPRRLSVALVEDAGVDVRHVVDLGAGTGAYLHAVLEAFPDARGTWVDASEPMLSRARERLGPLGERVSYALHDVREAPHVPVDLPCDVVVSSRVIHHFRPEVVRSVFGAAFDALAPGGFLFNLDHVGSPPGWEARYRRVRPLFLRRRAGSGPAHTHDAPPQPLDEHLRWLEKAGFEPPDVPWKAFYSALVAARKPAAARGARPALHR